MSSPHNLGHPAREFPLGSRKKGKDGKFWQVIETKTGKARWKRVNELKPEADLSNIYDFRISRPPSPNMPQHLKYLDLNRDNYISVYEFLASRPSLGPRAQPGKIDFHYQNITNVINFFLRIVQRDPRLRFGVVCIPEGRSPINPELKGSVFIYLKENKLYQSPGIKETINNCRRQGIRFVIMTLNIADTVGPKGSSHQNMLIVDTKKETIERFEPHGQIKKLFYKDDQKKINRMIPDKLIKPNKLKLKYLSPNLISPLIGPQRKADAFCGMCVTFSIMYTHLRLLNPHLSQKKVTEMMMRGTKERVKEKILKYARFVEEILKKYT
jgi:hypothetical protein